MKKTKTILVASCLLMFFALGSFAQVKDIEKTYEISGAAKRGALAQVEYDS